MSMAINFFRYGKVRVEKNWNERLKNAVVWYDAFSIPQLNRGNLLLAVESIPAYIEQASMFMVLCPLVEHHEQLSEDGQHRDVLSYASWQDRGWCRMEAVCRLLSRNTGPVVVINSKKNYELGRLQDLFFMPVGEGTFSCCTMNHMINGQKIPCDREKVVGALTHLVRKLLLDLEQSSDQKDYHFLRTLWPVVFSGLPMPDIALPLVSTDTLPLPPLFYEVLSRNLDGIKKLVEGRADVNATVPGTLDGGLIGAADAKGLSVLMAALFSCRSEQDFPILDYLKKMGADMSYRTPTKIPYGLLFACGGVINHQGAKWVIENSQPCDVRAMDTMTLQIFFPDLIELLMQRGVEQYLRNPIFGLEVFARMSMGRHPVSVEDQKINLYIEETDQSNNYFDEDCQQKHNFY